jgi:formamidopyrimidine-DNA glycosylase
MRETSLDEFVGGDDTASDASETGEPDRGDVGASEQPTHDAGDAPDADIREAAATVEATGADAVQDDADADPHGVDAPPDQTESTFVWSADGAACAHCGTAATRRWRDGGDLVCPSCKTW